MTMVVNRTRCLVFLGELLILLILFGALLAIRFTLHIFKRGFFCNDESLMHPYHGSTVPYWSVIFAGFAMNGAAIFILVPLVARKYRQSSSSCCHTMLEQMCYMWPCILMLVCGFLVTYILTEIPKKMVGRLRPHFIPLCKPKYNGTCTATLGYIEAFTCTGPATEEQMTEMRKSFPSGHTSSSFYLAVSFMFMLQAWMRFRATLAIRAFLQTAAFALALYVGVSRISDYKHHWSDVLAGAIIGIVVAIVTKSEHHSTFFNTWCSELLLNQQQNSGAGTVINYSTLDSDRRRVE